MHVTVTDKNGRTALCCPVLGGYCHPAEQFAMKFIAIFAEKYAFGTDLARMVAVTVDDSKLWGQLDREGQSDAGYHPGPPASCFLCCSSCMNACSLLFSSCRPRSTEESAFLSLTHARHQTLQKQALRRILMPAEARRASRNETAVVMSACSLGWTRLLDSRT